MYAERAEANGRVRQILSVSKSLRLEQLREREERNNAVLNEKGTREGIFG